MEIYLNLPPYLREWLADRCGGSLPIVFPRGSLELKILHTTLRSPRKGETPPLRCPSGWTAVSVPAFRGFNMESRNYLPERGRFAIENVIRERFDLDLWDIVADYQLGAGALDAIVDAWMDSRGIEPTDTNTQAVKKRFQRLRDRTACRTRQRRLRARKKQENPENNH